MTLAQVPEGIGYQSVIRDSENNLIKSAPVGLKVSILQGSDEGPAVYVETHSLSTNQNGLVTFTIGQGDALEGIFSEIDWSEGPYWLQTETDPSGGTNYSVSAVNKFWTVPYAFVVKDFNGLDDLLNRLDVLEDALDAMDPLYNLQLAVNMPGAGFVTGEGEYEAGEEVLVSAEANEGWMFVHWMDPDGVINTNASFTYTMPATDITLTAVFKQVYSLNLEVNVSGAGVVTGEGNYEAGEAVPVSAEANGGWMFVHWTGPDGIISTNASFTYIMPADDITLTAVFEQMDEVPGTVVDIDGNVYETVIIGNQEWMAENLQVSRYKNGDPIATGLSNSDWLAATEGAYAYLFNDEDWLDAYGKLYNWFAVDDTKGLCPYGWRVPDNDDWDQLKNYVDSQGYPNEDFNNEGMALALRSCRQVNSPLGGGCNTDEHPRWSSSATLYGFDEFGFAALPGGRRSGLDGTFTSFDSGNWWSATEEADTDNAYYRHIQESLSAVYTFTSPKVTGLSVRCVREAGDAN